MNQTLPSQFPGNPSGNAAERFDAIAIGSGIGGLATASLLAQLEGKRVLVLERHFQIGGFTHTFSRKGEFEWDVGLHYVGEVGVGSVGRAVFDFITGGRVNWQPMPDVYDRLVFPHFTHDLRAGRANLMSGLIERFPHERPAIEQYFKDLERASNWLTRYMITQTMTGTLWPLARLIRRYGEKRALVTTGEYMDVHFSDEQLKAVLLGQWGLYGLPPSQSAFVGHALLVRHYMEGGYYPVGGSARIAESIVPIIEVHGGKVLENHAVEEILIEDGRAIGVRALEKKGKKTVEKTFLADMVFSNAGAHTTYTCLIPKEVKLPSRQKVANFPNGAANVTVYLGLEGNPRELGFEGENYWIYAGYDHDEIHARRNELVDGKVSHAFLSFPSLKNPVAKGNTAEIIAFLDIEPFLSWENEPWHRRGEEYEALKERIGDALVAFVGERFSGFAERIVYREVATPLTTEHFTNHRNGNIYGLPMVPEKFRVRWLSPKTPIRGFYLTGSDAAFFGIVGAMMSGVLSMAVATGQTWKLPAFFARAMKYSTALHQETGRRINRRTGNSKN